MSMFTHACLCFWVLVCLLVALVDPAVPPIGRLLADRGSLVGGRLLADRGSLVGGRLLADRGPLVGRVVTPASRGRPPAVVAVVAEVAEPSP